MIIVQNASLLRGVEGPAGGTGTDSRILGPAAAAAA